MTDGKDNKTDIMGFTADIVASHVSNNAVPLSELPDLITKVYNSLSVLSGKAIEAEKQPQPAVSVKKSITPDFIICLEDGKKLKMLKRHIKTAYNLSPEEYRAKWGLPSDYPMVAPSYAQQRRKLAKEIGLGTNNKRTS